MYPSIHTRSKYKCLYTASKTFRKHSTFDLIIVKKDGYCTQSILQEINSHAVWDFYSCEWHAKSWHYSIGCYTIVYFFQMWICVRIIFALKKSPKVYLHHVNHVKMMCCVAHVFQFSFASWGEKSKKM